MHHFCLRWHHPIQNQKWRLTGSRRMYSNSVLLGLICNLFSKHFVLLLLDKLRKPLELYFPRKTEYKGKKNHFWNFFWNSCSYDLSHWINPAHPIDLLNTLLRFAVYILLKFLLAHLQHSDPEWLATGCLAISYLQEIYLFQWNKQCWIQADIIQADIQADLSN